MNSHVSSILLGVNDMERSKRFYTEGLGWKVQNDYKISVFFVPHGGSMVGFYGRDGLADMVGVSPNGSGFSGIVFTYVVRREDRVDEILDEAEKAGGKILKPAAKLKWGVQTDPDRSRRIVWMIKRMIKQGRRRTRSRSRPPFEYPAFVCVGARISYRQRRQTGSPGAGVGIATATA
jgi:uncharacterized protein